MMIYEITKNDKGTAHTFRKNPYTSLLQKKGYFITDLKVIDIQIDAERGLGYKSIKSAYDLIRSAASIFEVELPSTRKLRFPPKSIKSELPDLDKALRIIIVSSVKLPCLLAVWCGGMRITVYIRTPKQRVRDSLKLFDDYMYGVIRDTRT